MEKKDTKKVVNNLLKSERGRAILFFLFYFVFFLVIILMARTNLSNNKKNNTNTSNQSTTSIKADYDLKKLEEGNYRFTREETRNSIKTIFTGEANGGRSSFLMTSDNGIKNFFSYNDIYLEKDLLKQNYLEQMTVKEVVAAAIMAVAIFAFSNLSFLNENAPFASRERADIFSIRTLIDFGGIAILHAYQSRISEYVAEKELSVMNVMLKSQYDQYRNYQDSLDLIQMKYHDLKHQITGLRAESDEEKRKKWIDSMEKEIAAFENISRTGNQVLDTILAAKIFHCRKNHIQITCVADGKLLDHMHVTDICSIFGNALDNAIEHVILIPDPEKRLIHLTVSAQKGFVFIKIENYCEAEISKNEEDLITTTKKDSKNHGFGLKSIRKAVEKYDGSVVFGVQQNWFELKILLPRVL